MNLMYLLFSFTVGGTERLVADICNEMINRKNKVYLYIVNDLIDDDLIDSIDDNVTLELQRRTAGENKINTLIKIAQYIRINKIDVVHCNSFDSPELLLLAKLISPRIKVIYTVHGMNQYKKLNIIRKIYRNIICDKIVGISECVRSDLERNGAAKNKTEVVYNGIDLNKYKECNQRHYNETETIVGCVARIMPKVKGQDLLLEAANIIKNRGYSKFKFVFAGGVSESQRKEFQRLEEYVIENELEEIISFIGNVTDVPGFMNSIDICVVPSRTEGFGLTLIEAMAMGVPCVAMDTEGPEELIKKINIGDMFESGNSKSLADKILEVDTVLCEKKKLCMKNKDIIKNEFCVEEMCNKLEILYMI